MKTGIVLICYCYTTYILKMYLSVVCSGMLINIKLPTGERYHFNMIKPLTGEEGQGVCTQ